jgi:hypothetical protein
VIAHGDLAIRDKDYFVFFAHAKDGSAVPLRLSGRISHLVSILRPPVAVIAGRRMVEPTHIVSP